jgi:hypothetical protein
MFHLTSDKDFIDLTVFVRNQVYSPIKFIRGSERIQGKFYITNFRFYFKSDVRKLIFHILIF